jgi:hypothetical protein
MRTKEIIREEIICLRNELEAIEEQEKLHNPVNFAEWLARKGCIYYSKKDDKALFLFDGQPKNEGLLLHIAFKCYLNQANIF